MLAPEKFKEILKNTPLIALDLLIYDDQGRALLGLRTNEPGKGFWSVPGGRIYKDETLKDAFKRISSTELGITLDPGKAQFEGIYEHFYEENFFGENNIRTHYVTIGCGINLSDPTQIRVNAQHNKYAFFTVKELLESKEVLENTKRFFSGDSDDLFVSLQNRNF
ncbi:MAG TPA: GDP-mannose mannosyl hydrolase [Sphingobacteriaceae bacterium]|nr:GDP-mannose mannosyl hydrolase [Sphingobacteriaceae bacterium]